MVVLRERILVSKLGYKAFIRARVPTTRLVLIDLQGIGVTISRSGNVSCTSDSSRSTVLAGKSS